MKIFLETIKRNRLKCAGFFTFYVIAAVVVSVCGVLVTKLTGEISQAAVMFDVDVITRFLGIMAVIIGIKAVTAALSAFFTGRFTGETGYKMRNTFAEYFANSYFSDLDRKNSGAMLSLYANDLPLAVKLITDGSLGLVSGIISVVVAFIYMATINPLYTAIFFLTFPLLVLLQVKISTPIQKKALEISTARADFNAVVNDSLQNTSTVIAYSLESVMEERYLSSYDKFYKIYQDYLRLTNKLVMSGIVATMLPIVFIYAASGLSVADGRMTISEFVAFTAVADIAGSWLGMLSQNLRTIRVNAASAAKVNESMYAPAEDLASGVIDFTDSDTAASFDSVSFSYAYGAKVLDNVCFEIRKGEKTAIVGGSGSGKSTILKLLLALYDPSEGGITVSGHDIAEVSKSALRKHLAYVPQDSFMFPESIRDNITRSSKGNVSEDLLIKACEGAGILEFINSLPDGFDTMLSELAENISGGQRQRLAIARAFLQDAPIVLFDEATSALDPITEREVLQSFDTLVKGKTVIMVAHRMSAITACDNIIVMDNGRVAGTGNHDELLSGNKAYAALYESYIEGGSENEQA